MNPEGRDLRRSWIPWIPLAFVLVIALAVGTIGSTGPKSNQDRVFAIAQTIKCPVCQGETVADSNADISRAIRVEIAKRVEQGETDDEIRQYVAQNYQEAVLLTPTSSGVTGLVWVLPVVALILALAGLVYAFRRWSGETVVHATEEDRALVRDALDAEHADEPTN